MELNIHNVTHRLFTDLNGNIHFQSELPSPYQYLSDCKIKKINNNNDNNNKNKNNNNNTYLNLLPSIYGDGVETTIITIAPAAPSLDLLPGWETQQFDGNSNQYSIPKLLALRADWDSVRSKNDNNNNIDNGIDHNDSEDDLLEKRNENQKFLNNLNESNLGEGGEFVDRIAPLSLCPGEIRYEYVLAVLQPLLTGVLINDDQYVEVNSGGRSDLSMQNSSSMNLKMKMKTKKDLNTNLNMETDMDTDLEFIAEDVRISVHQWSKVTMKNIGESLLTPTQLQSPAKSNKLSQHNNSNSMYDITKQIKYSSSKLKSNELVKTSLLQRDFSGPLKLIKDETGSFRSKVLPINSPLNCKLTNCYKKGIKSKNDRNTHISNLKVVDGRNGNDSSSVNTLSSSSLSVPLGFKFEFSSDVVAYRIDVETLALDSGKNNDILLKDKNHRDEEGTLNPSQLYLRRSVHTSSTSQIYFSLFLS